MQRLIETLYFRLTRLIGRVTRRYYFEDFIRVYPDGIVINRLGRRATPGTQEINNYLNHRKFYRFAAQFARGKRVADIGCGSGYGCEIFHEAGASQVYGCDISRSAVQFARSRYPGVAEFSVQGITDLREYSDASFDVTTSSEVLEHIKEYGMEREALSELKRVTRPEGLIVIGTPNTEMTDDHGFAFDEIDALCRDQFSRYVIFENALEPFGERKCLWHQRLSAAKTGAIVTQAINLSETFLPQDEVPEIKTGQPPGHWQLGPQCIDTSLLHNTHSWIVVALV